MYRSSTLKPEPLRVQLTINTDYLDYSYEANSPETS